MKNSNDYLDDSSEELIHALAKDALLHSLLVNAAAMSDPEAIGGTLRNHQQTLGRAHALGEELVNRVKRASESADMALRAWEATR